MLGPVWFRSGCPFPELGWTRASSRFCQPRPRGESWGLTRPLQPLEKATTRPAPPALLARGDCCPENRTCHPGRWPSGSLKWARPRARTWPGPSGHADCSPGLAGPAVTPRLEAVPSSHALWTRQWRARRGRRPVGKGQSLHGSWAPAHRSTGCQPLPASDLLWFVCFCCPSGMELPGQGSDPSHSRDPSCSCSCARSLTPCVGPGIGPASQSSHKAVNSVAPQQTLHLRIVLKRISGKG